MSEETTTEAPAAPADWKAALPESLQNAPWIGKADSLEAAVGQLNDAAQYIGNAIRIPSEDAGDADRQAFNQKLLDKVPGLMPVPKSDDLDAARDALRALGMPEKPEQYDVTGIDHAPDGEELGRLRTVAHEAGMTSAQFRKWVAEETATTKAATDQAEFERNEELKQLRGEWGFAFDEKITNAVKAAEATGAPDYVVQMIKDGTMDAKGLRWMDNVYGQLATGAPQGAIQGKDTAPTLTPAEIEARLGEIEGRLWAKDTPPSQIPMLTEKRMKLMEQLVKD